MWSARGRCCCTWREGREEGGAAAARGEFGWGAGRCVCSGLAVVVPSASTHNKLAGVAVHAHGSRLTRLRLVVLRTDLGPIQIAPGNAAPGTPARTHAGRLVEVPRPCRPSSGRNCNLPLVH